MTEQPQVEKKHHTVLSPGIGSWVRGYLLAPWTRWAWLALAVMMLVVLTFHHLRTGALWLGDQIAALPAQLAQTVQKQIYPAVTVDDFVLAGMQYADDHEMKAHLLKVLARNVDRHVGVPTLADYDLVGIQTGFIQHPWIVAARVSRLQTGQITVFLQEHEPRALYVNAQKEYWLVNEAGEAFVRIPAGRVPEFASLLRLSGDDAERFLPELLAARALIPEAFEHMIRADRMRYSGWKLQYLRPAGSYYVYVHGKNVAELLPSLEKLVMLEQRYTLSERAVRGYDLRAWPKVRVDLIKAGLGE